MSSCFADSGLVESPPPTQTLKLHTSLWPIIFVAVKDKSFISVCAVLYMLDETEILNFLGKLEKSCLIKRNRSL